MFLILNRKKTVNQNTLVRELGFKVYLMFAVEEIEQLTISVISSSLMKHNMSSSDSKTKFLVKAFYLQQRSIHYAMFLQTFCKKSTQKFPGPMFMEGRERRR